MPRRLPEKTRHIEGRSRRFGGQAYRPGVFQLAPVKEGQEIDVVIDDIGNRGDRISRMQSFLIFVPQAKIGERLRAKIVRVTRKFAIAEKVEMERGERIEN